MSGRKILVSYDEYNHMKDQLALYRKWGCSLFNRDMYDEELAGKNREIERLGRELNEARALTDDVRKAFLETCADVEAECDEKVARFKSNIQELVNALRAKDDEIEALKEEMRSLKGDVESLKKENERLEAEVTRLTVSSRKNYANSSLPSSRDPDHGRLTNNSRVKTGRSPGGQPGHPHHGRKRLPPTDEVNIDSPDGFSDGGACVYVGEEHRQVVGIKVVPVVRDFVAKVYRDKKTGKKVCASFPEGVDDDVNYDESVKAFAFLLNNHLNVSVDKISGFMAYFMGGVAPSTGWVYKIMGEFAEKSAPEWDEIFSSLCSADVFNEDYTFARVDGGIVPVSITKSSDSVLLQLRERRGREGIKGTPIELNEDGVLVCDGENTFANLPRKKKPQRCIQHMQRHLREAGQNEPDLSWHKEMNELFQYAVHVFNEYGKVGEAVPDGVIADIDKRYDEIIALGVAEYELHPPTKGFHGGRSSLKALTEEKDSFLLFLYDPGVPPTNNSAEVEARHVKRKLAVINGFRTKAGADNYCRCLSVLETMRIRGENIYEEVMKIFARPKAAKWKDASGLDSEEAA